jgi:hypothetical protein
MTGGGGAGVWGEAGHGPAQCPPSPLPATSEPYPACREPLAVPLTKSFTQPARCIMRFNWKLNGLRGYEFPET